MVKIYGLPNAERTAIIEERSLNSKKLLNVPWSDRPILNPTEGDYIAAGWLLKVIPVPGEYERRGEIIIGEVAGEYTYEKNPWPDEEIFNNKMLSFQSAVQTHLDNLAKSWGYDNIVSLCSYAGNSHPKYSAEGAAGLSWRSSVWDHCEKELAKIAAETRIEPESIESFIAELPVIVRP